MNERFSLAVRLFGSHRESAGRPAVVVELDAGASVGDLKSALSSHPALAESVDSAAVAVNRRYAGEMDPVAEGDEVALIPPVAGG